MKRNRLQFSGLLAIALSTATVLMALPTVAQTANETCYTLKLKPAPDRESTYLVESLAGQQFGPIQVLTARKRQYTVGMENQGYDGWPELVVRINNVKQVTFFITYGAAPFGMSVNIGDSATNNGFGGDGATQSNDAEMQIGDPANQSLFSTMRVWGRDGSNPPLLGQVSNVVQPRKAVKLVVSNERLRYSSGELIGGIFQSSFLYALNGQPDTEGPVNYDIYAAFNRSIGTSSRWGRGVTEVRICPVLQTQSPTNG